MPAILDVSLDDGCQPLVFNWGPSSFLGFGVYALNIALTLATDPTVAPIFPTKWDRIVLDPIRAARLELVRPPSDALRNALAEAGEAMVNVPVLHAMQDNLGRDETPWTGSPLFGVIFSVDTHVVEESRELAKSYRRIITGCTWNEQILRANGIDHVTTILQGVDPGLFHPGPRSGYFNDSFVIFSGGKLEFRKAQDLVLAGFKAFRERHPEAILVTAWHSPWPELARSLIPPPPLTEAGVVDIGRWAADAGLPPGSVRDVGQVPNSYMPYILREADVALFANRAEPGTNLVAMEAIACGVPTILSANTGHLDILAMDAAIPLTRQDAIVYSECATEGWGESDVDEIVEALESVWRDREAARALGLRGSTAMHALSWDKQVRTLAATVKSFL